MPMSTKELELEPAPRASRGVPRWWLLSERVLPMREDVSRARHEIRKQQQQAGKQELESVFNPNPLRHQLPLASDDPMLALLMAALASAGHLRSHAAGRAVALYSSAGCEQQQWHADYDPLCKASRKRKYETAEQEQRRQEQAKLRCIRDMRDCHKPLGVFWAVEEGCRLMVVGPEGESVEVHLELGEVLLFHGDLVHAGAAYERDNMRVHLYLHAIGVVPPNGNTYYVEDFVPVCKVEWRSSERPVGI